MKNRILIVCAVLMLAAAATASSQTPPGWPQWRGPNGDGTSTETGWNPMALKDGAKVLWKTDIGYGYSNVVIQAGRLYAMGAMPRKGVIFSCLDAATGAVLWQQSHDQGGIYNNPDPHATPVVDGERVYGITLKGMLYCLQTADGQVLWKKDLVAEFQTKGSWYGWVASPVIAGDLLLINASDKGIALNKHTGTPVWVTAEDRITYKGNGPNGSLVTPLVCSLGGRTCALLVTNTLFLAVDLATGSPLWSLRHGEEIHSVTDCVVWRNRVLLELTWTSTLFDISGPRPSVVWSGNMLYNSIFSPVLVDGFLYGAVLTTEGSEGGDYSWPGWVNVRMPFRCIDWDTGKVVWEHVIPGGASVIVVDGKLIMLDLKGTIRIAKASPAGYEELAAADILQGEKYVQRIFPTPPVFCDGRIYCRNFNNAIVCIDVSK